MLIEEAIKNRRSIRKYSKQKPDWRKIILAIDAARYAPMAGGMFSLKFIVVQDSAVIRKLQAASQQDFVGDAQAVVVVISEIDKVTRSYDERGEMYARQQAGAAMENFLLECVSQGLATCWVGYFDDSQVRETLSIPANMNVEAMFPIGIESPMNKPIAKPKPDLENVLFFDKFGNSYMEPNTRVRLGNV